MWRCQGRLRRDVVVVVSRTEEERLGDSFGGVRWMAQHGEDVLLSRVLVRKDKKSEGETSIRKEKRLWRVS